MAAGQRLARLVLWWRVLLHEFLALLDALLEFGQSLLDSVHLRIEHLAESQHFLNTFFLQVMHTTFSVSTSINKVMFYPTFVCLSVSIFV